MPLLSAGRSQALLKNVGLVVVIAILAIWLSIAGRYQTWDGQPRNKFLNAENLVTGVATNMSVYAIMAVGMTIVIITGGIDISVGSIMGLSAILTAWLCEKIPPNAPGIWVIPTLIAVPVGIGLLCGLLNGLLVVSLRLHPFIVTLGTMSIFRGLVNVLPPDKTMPRPQLTGPSGLPFAVPGAFREGFMTLAWHGVRFMPFIVTIVVTIIGTIYLKMTAPGVQTFAVGGNEEAARLSGVRVHVIKFIAYAISGACAGIAGMATLGRWGTASATTGTGYELTVVAAAVIGGASLAGGRGAAAGALLGALVIRLIENSISIKGWPEEYQKIIVGIAIVIAASIDQLTNRLSGRAR